MNIFSIGSCRTQIPLWKTHSDIYKNRQHNSVCCHYLSEIIQMIKFLKSKVMIPQSECNMVFSDAYKSILSKKILQVNLESAKTIIIEISSIKNVSKGGLFYNINRIPSSKRKFYKLQYDTEKDILEKMRILNNLLIGKSIVFVPHINIDVPGVGNLKQRKLIQKTVKLGANELNQSFFDILDCIKEIGIDESFPVCKGKIDVNHLTPAAINIVKNNLKKFLKI